MDNIKSEQSIPYTETHIITLEDLKQAYYRGYIDGIKRSLFKFTGEEVKDGTQSKFTGEEVKDGTQSKFAL